MHGQCRAVFTAGSTKQNHQEVGCNFTMDADVNCCSFRVNIFIRFLFISFSDSEQYDPAKKNKMFDRLLQ